jgi:hypothetical protein
MPVIERVRQDGERYVPFKYPDGLYRVADPALANKKHHSANQIPIREEEIVTYLAKGFPLRMIGERTGQVNLIAASQITQDVVECIRGRAAEALELALSVGRVGHDHSPLGSLRLRHLDSFMRPGRPPASVSARLVAAVLDGLLEGLGDAAFSFMRCPVRCSQRLTRMSRNLLAGFRQSSGIALAQFLGEPHWS